MLFSFMMSYYFLMYKFSGDLIFYNLFFNYSHFCYLNVFCSFFIEFGLIFFIIFSILFGQNRYILKDFFYLFFYFLIFLMLCTCFFWFCNINFCIITFSLQNNYFTIISKLICICLLLIILYILKRRLFFLADKLYFQEFFLILCFLLLFICVLLSAVDFFIIFLSLEGISFVVYTLCAILKKSFINFEAIIKYFLINSIASSLLLWTLSYVYICILTMDIYEFKYYLIYSFEILNLQYMYPICLLLLISIFFKLAIFPFHWWVADIYDGFWTPLTIIYGVLIKFVFFLFLFNLWLNILSICFFLQPFLIFSSLGSILYGSLGALIQVKIKRFLAYTSIAQSGYILLGLTTNTFNGFFCSFLYLSYYTFASICFFLILVNIEHILYKKNLIFLNQLYSVLYFNKEISLHFLSILFIMAAVPPFNSFFIKFFILLIGLEVKMEILISFILCLSLISTYYYLNFIHQLLFFKLSNTKLYICYYNRLYLFILRLHAIYLLIPFFFWTGGYSFNLFFIYSCLWPLSFSLI